MAGCRAVAGWRGRGRRSRTGRKQRVGMIGEQAQVHAGGKRKGLRQGGQVVGFYLLDG